MHSCCSGSDFAPTPPAAPCPKSPRAWTRVARACAQWALPVTALTFVPKCPACLAGYILLATGIGLSTGAAQALRWTIIAASAAALVILLLNLLFRTFRPAP